MPDDRPTLEKLRDVSIIAALGPSVGDRICELVTCCCLLPLVLPMMLAIVGTMFYYTTGPVPLVIGGLFVLAIVVQLVVNKLRGSPPTP